MPWTNPLRRRLRLAAATCLPLAALLSAGAASAQDLASFAVLAGEEITNTGPTTINGNVGVSPGTSVTGFPPANITGGYTLHVTDAVAAEAQNQLTTAYNVLAGRPSSMDLTSQDLAGMVLTPGVYSFAEGAELNGDLTLDAAGDPNAIFIFNIGSTLKAGAGSKVLVINQANPANIFFRVGSSATLFAGAQFKGKILALASITLVTGATINCGAALARTGLVALDTNVIGICEVNAVDITDALGDEATEAETDIAEAIDDYFEGTGALPIGFQVLGALSPAELAAALGQLSGEIGTAVAPTTSQAMNSFLDMIDTRRGPGTIDIAGNDGSADNGGAGPERGTVSVMGYMPTSSPGGTAFDGFRSGFDPSPDQGWTVWSSAYGGYRLTRGDVDDGTHDRSAAAFGLAVGFERQVTPDSMFGLALSGGGTNFNLDDSLGSGRSAMLQAALYGRAETESAYLSGSLAYGIHDMHTERQVTFAGIDEFAAQFYAHDVAAELEVGYRLGWLTPYVGLRGQVVATPGYEETTESGSSTFALGYQPNAVFTARSEVGARAAWSAELDASTVTLAASAAWVHEFNDNAPTEAYFLALPGSSFEVGGASADTDALVLSVSGQLQMDTGLSLSGAVGGEFSGNSYAYSGNAKLSYRW